MTVTYDFTGKTAFVTGASAGMGAATARAFAEAGAEVAIVDLDGDAAQHLADELNASGFTAIAVQCDVSDEDQVAAAVQATVEAFGTLDMAFNNAGIMLPPVDSADETADAFDKIVAVNLRGVWASMKHELVRVREHLPLRLGQARRHRFHQKCCAAIRTAWSASQRGVPRNHQYTHGRTNDRGRRARFRRCRERRAVGAARAAGGDCVGGAVAV